MAIIKHRQTLTDFDLVARSQAEIACIQHFRDGRLSRYLEALSFNNMAYGIAEKYFYNSRDKAIYDHAARVIRALLIIAPVVQRQPLTVRFDWQPGHVLSHFRFYTKGNIRRFHFGVRCVERSYAPTLLIANLESMGIHDSMFVDELVELYDRYDARINRTLQHKLADLVFDPVLMHGLQTGFELRQGNVFYRLGKQPFEGSSDLRYTWGTVMQYSIRTRENKQGGRYMEIRLTDKYLEDVRVRFKDALAGDNSPPAKVRFLYRIVFDVVQVARWAGSADHQISELSQWLTKQVSSLAGTMPAAYGVPKRLFSLWTEQRDNRLLFKVPNFFLYPDKVERDVYMNFFNPFRGGSL
jgi:hypothetical protein